MKMLSRLLLSSVAILVLVLTSNPAAQAQARLGIEDRFADVNGVPLHYLSAGKGDPAP